MVVCPKSGNISWVNDGNGWFWEVSSSVFTQPFLRKKGGESNQPIIRIIITIWFLFFFLLA